MLLAAYLAHTEEWSGGKGKMEAMRKRIAKALGSRIGFGDFVDLAIRKGLHELEATGSIAMPFSTQPLDPKLSSRFAELDKALELEGGIANAVLGDLLRDFMQGEADLIYSSWNMGDDTERCHREFFRLVDRWRAEDGLPRLPHSKRSLFAWTGEPKDKAKEERGRVWSIDVEHFPELAEPVRAVEKGNLTTFFMDTPTYRHWCRKAKDWNLPTPAHALVEEIRREANLKLPEVEA